VGEASYYGKEVAYGAVPFERLGWFSSRTSGYFSFEFIQLKTPLWELAIPITA
jgi:hypothetical protein